MLMLIISSYRLLYYKILKFIGIRIILICDFIIRYTQAIGSNDWDKIWKTAVMNAIYAQ